MLIIADGNRWLATARGDSKDEVKKGLCKRVFRATAGVGSRGAAEGGVGCVAGGEGRERVRREMGSCFACGGIGTGVRSMAYFV